MTLARLDGAHSAGTTSLATCAKINLTLDVLGKRDDGYHELDSLVIGVGLCDELRLAPASRQGIAFHCNQPDLSSSDNLAYRAAALLAEAAGFNGDARPALTTDTASAGLALHLTKRIPVGGGLGGGSGNAAGALMLLSRAWELNWTTEQLAAFGSQFGSDVPLFFHLPSAHIEGRGERVQPIDLTWSGWVLLVSTGEFVSTREVYQALRPEEYGPQDSGMEQIQSARTAEALMALCRNGLESAVARVAPRVTAWQNKLESHGFGCMRISGAGSVLFRLFDEETPARSAASAIAQQFPTLTTLVVSAPVGLRMDS